MSSEGRKELDALLARLGHSSFVDYQPVKISRQTVHRSIVQWVAPDGARTVSVSAPRVDELETFVLGGLRALVAAMGGAQ